MLTAGLCVLRRVHVGIEKKGRCPESQHPSMRNPRTAVRTDAQDAWVPGSTARHRDTTVYQGRDQTHLRYLIRSPRRCGNNCLVQLVSARVCLDGNDQKSLPTTSSPQRRQP